MKGYVNKKGRRVRNWKRRFFVLRGGTLSYYTDETCATRKGKMRLDQCLVDGLRERDETGRACLALSTKGRTLFFQSDEACRPHLDAGAKRVLISAPAKGVSATIVFGVNDETLTAEDVIVSNASCTTNCLAPVAKVLNDLVGIERGFMTTIHSYTNDQRMLDQMHSDMRRARGGAQNMIPTTTGAARAVGLVLPELAGKLDGSSVRVPTPNVSLVDLVFTPGRDTSAEELNAALKAAAEGKMKGVLDYTDQPLVSSDFNHYPASSTIDSLETSVMEGKLARVVSWYDNEWGFSNRMIDTAGVMAKFL